MVNEQEREVLTVPEVADYLRVTAKTVYGLIKRGELPSFRVGRVLRCHRDDVVAFVEASRMAGTNGVRHSAVS